MVTAASQSIKKQEISTNPQNDKEEKKIQINLIICRVCPKMWLNYIIVNDEATERARGQKKISTKMNAQTQQKCTFTYVYTRTVHKMPHECIEEWEREQESDRKAREHQADGLWMTDVCAFFFSSLLFLTVYLAVVFYFACLGVVEFKYKTLVFSIHFLYF